jgi:hypothetical protein
MAGGSTEVIICTTGRVRLFCFLNTEVLRYGKLVSKTLAVIVICSNIQRRVPQRQILLRRRRHYDVDNDSDALFLQ